jgi:hypothetical protein
MFIACDEPMAINTPVRITCAFSLGGRQVELPGTVRWTTVGGFGAQLGLLGARETHAIAELIRAARAGRLPLGRDHELTAHNAVASTFGLRGKEYRPALET